VSFGWNRGEAGAEVGVEVAVEGTQREVCMRAQRESRAKVQVETEAEARAGVETGLEMPAVAAALQL